MADLETKDESRSDFVPSEGLTSSEARELLAVHGRNELVEKTKSKFRIYLDQLYGPMPIMIWIAMLIEAIIQNWLDFGVLTAIQFGNATLGWYETCRAGDAVAALKASLKPKATVKRDGQWAQIDAAEVVPGDLVLLGAGSAVPADCLVNDGQIDVDQSGLTGESLPVTMYRGDSVKMGSTVTRGEVEGTVEYNKLIRKSGFTGANTFFGKTAQMIQSATGELGNLQKILMRVMIVLLIISFLLCGISMAYLLIKGNPFMEVLEFTVILLIASIPIAIEIVCTTTLAIGSRKMAAHGAIVSRLPAIEEMAGMNMLCSDKTGTLTLNKMVIQEDCPTFFPGMDREQVLKLAAMAAKWKEPAKDALDTMVLGAAPVDQLEKYEMLDHMPFDPTVKRTESTIKGPDGKVFKVTKGAPHVILKLIKNKAEIEKAVELKVTELGLRGIRALSVARSDEKGDWYMMGILTFLDPPRPDTKYTIERALEFGVDVKMITGDHVLIAKETARQLGMGSNIQGANKLPSFDTSQGIPKDLAEKYGDMILEADGFAQVFPEHKFLIVETLRQAGFACGMTGDGVNDAPALKKADVGIAVAGATDAARAAADIVLTGEGLSVIVEGIIISREIFQRVYNFFNYRIAATLQLLLFFFISVFAFEPPAFGWDPEVAGHFFKMPVLMLMLITVLNDGTLISVGYDNVIPSPRPEKWNLPVLFTISSVLAAVSLLSSLLLLWAALSSISPNSFFQSIGLPAMEYGQVTTAIYLKVSVSDFLTLFSARVHSFFFKSMPSLVLLGAASISLIVSTILACFWPTTSLDGVAVEGLVRGEYKLWPLWVWLYCIAFWLIQDVCKVAAYWVIAKYDIFHYNTAKLVNARGAATFDKNPLVRASAGLVETKLLTMKVDDTQEKMQELADKTGQPALERASQNMKLVRNSIAAAKRSFSLKGVPEDDVEAGVLDIKETMDKIQEAADEAQRMTPEDYDALNKDISSVKDVAGTLQKISAAVYNKPVTGEEDILNLHPAQNKGTTTKGGYTPL